jgi:hypothetical protein
MKFVIPPQFHMGARTFRIKRNEKLLKELGYKAQLDDKNDLVRLSERSSLSMFESLLHEMLHEAHYLCGSEDAPEGKILALAGFMAQALVSMGIEPDFSLIGEEE